MSYRTIQYDCQPQDGVQSLQVREGDIVEVLGDDTNGWTWSKKFGTELTGYVPTLALGPYPAPTIPEQIETPLSLELQNVNTSQHVDSQVKNFFSQFGDIYYFDSNPPSHLHPTHRFFIDILSSTSIETIKSYLTNQPFYSPNIQLNKKFKQPNPLELYLTPISPTCTEADIRALIHPANPTKVSLFFPKNNKNNKSCVIVFPDTHSANAAFRDRSRWMAQQPGLTVRFSIQNSKPTHGTAPESGSASRPVSSRSNSTSVFLKNLPNGIIPKDIILNLFPTSVITNLKINSSLPGQPVTAVVHFKEEREAQQAISQSGSLTYLQNRIEVSVNREKPGHQNKPSPFSHGPVPVKVVSPPPQPIPPMPGGDPSTYGSKPQPGPRPYQGPPQPGGNPSTYGSKPQPVSGGNRTTNGFKPPPPPRVNVTQNICPLTNRQISRRACLRGEPNVIYEAEALQSFVSENGMSPTTFESMSLGDIQFM